MVEASTSEPSVRKADASTGKLLREIDALHKDQVRILRAAIKMHERAARILAPHIAASTLPNVHPMEISFDGTEAIAKGATLMRKYMLLFPELDTAIRRAATRIEIAVMATSISAGGQ